MASLLAGKKRGNEMMAAHLFLALACVFVACIDISEASTVVNVYRMIQYDLRGTPYGSRRSGLNQLASSGLLGHSGADLTRAVVIMPLKKINITLLNDIVQNKIFVGGLLLLLPRNFGSGEDAESSDPDGDEDGSGSLSLAGLERLFFHRNILLPVYFAEENDELLALYNEVAANDLAGRPATAITGGYKLVTNVKEPKKISSTQLINIRGWLPGQRGEGDGVVLPMIAVVANYDTFGIAPSYSSGTDSNGSGVVALIEIARLFSRLYNNPRTRGRYNILFGLTSGGPFNYDGTRQWLENLDPRLLETMELAVCLNSVGSWDTTLHLHVSKPLKDPAIQELYKAFQDVADGMGVALPIVHKKINISNPRVPWEHEQFSKRRILAATLSGLPTAPRLFEHSGGLADGSAKVKTESVVKTVKLVAETIARHVYDHQGGQTEIFADGTSLAVNVPFISHWLDLLSQTPRVAPFITKKSPIITYLHKVLSEYLTDVSMKTVALGPVEKGVPHFVFYDITEAPLSVHQVASVTFDLFVALGVGAYLTALFVVLHIATKGLDDFMGVFRGPPPRKSKMA